MSTLQPIYTVDNCRAAYQLNWSLSIFWKGPAAPADIWLDALISATEPDGVRILEHHSPRPNVSQFLLSTKPRLAPAMAVRSIKGRLQYIIRRRLPKPFRRNYSIHSVGSANVDAIEKYVAGQLERHPRADPSVQDRLAAFQFEDPDVDLASPRRSAHASSSTVSISPSCTAIAVWT